MEWFYLFFLCVRGVASRAWRVASQILVFQKASIHSTIRFFLPSSNGFFKVINRCQTIDISRVPSNIIFISWLHAPYAPYWSILANLMCVIKYIIYIMSCIPMKFGERCRLLPHLQNISHLARAVGHVVVVDQPQAVHLQLASRQSGQSRQSRAQHPKIPNPLWPAGLNQKAKWFQMAMRTVSIMSDMS